MFEITLRLIAPILLFMTLSACASIGNNKSYLLKYKKHLIEWYEEEIGANGPEGERSRDTGGSPADRKLLAKQQQRVVEANTYLPSIYKNNMPYMLTNHYDSRGPSDSKIWKGDPLSVIINKVYLANNKEVFSRLGDTVRIPLNPAADSERIRPPLGAPRRRASVVCLEWPTSVRFRQPFAHRFSFERDLIGVVHEPVKNGIGQRRLPNRRVPVIDRELTGHEGGPTPVPIIEQFQEIAAVLIGQGRQPPVIQHYEVRLGEIPEQASIAAIAFGDRQVPEEPRESQVQGGEAQPTRHLRQRTGQIRLAGSRRAHNQHIVVQAHPLTGGERGDDAFVEPPRVAIIEIFQGGAAGEPGLGQSPRQPVIVPDRALAID